MTEEKLAELAALGVQIPPGEDELPYDDGEPMESLRHRKQMNLLIETLELHWKDRADGFVSGNMFVYFSLDQLKDRHFRGPDFFAVLGVPKRERKSWVVWEENKGPDVVIELLSASTAKVDKGEKKRVYQDELRVPEYFWYDPFSSELAGFRLMEGRYRSLKPDREGRLKSTVLGLWLQRWEGGFQGISATWLRWATEDGVLLPTDGEQERGRAEQERERAEQEARNAQHERVRAEQAEQALAAEVEARRRLESELAELRARGGG
jgi:Uma2 family endonuclease